MSGWRNLLLVVLLCLAPAAASASERGYWACENSQWVAVGHPVYDHPLRSCGEKPVPPVTEAACTALGGAWGPIGIFPAPVCRMPAGDAGRICGDADECQSTCLAKLSSTERDRVMHGGTVRKLGRCAPVYPVLGCLATVTHGAVNGILCLD